MARVDTDKGRWYYDRDENPYWSVTTILSNGLAKPALIAWAASEASKHAVSELAPVLQASKSILEEISSGDVTEDRLEKAVAAYNDRETLLGKLSSGVKTHVEKGRKEISGAHRRVRDTAADAGSEFHAAVEIYLKSGTWPALRDNAAAMRDQFMEFEEEHKPEYEAAELTVFNKTDQYAGTLDIIAKLPREDGLDPLPMVIDIKTGRGVYPDTILQLAAYRHAEFIELSEDNEQHPLPELDDTGGILHIRPDKWAFHTVPVGEEQFDMFRYCQQLAWFTREGGQEWFTSLA